MGLGGSHNVDDSEVETPGHCHLELWGTRLGERAGLINLGPGCTPARWPWLELGGFAQPSASTGASAAGSAGPAATADKGGVSALFGPTAKVTLRHDDTGFGAGATAGFTYDGSAGRMEAVSALVPLTWRLRPGVRLNVNAGAQYIRSDGALESVFGAQVEMALGRGFTLMPSISAGRAPSPATSWACAGRRRTTDTTSTWCSAAASTAPPASPSPWA